MELGQSLLERFTPGIESHFPDEELHPVTLLVLEVTQAMKDPKDGLRDVQHLGSGQELVEHIAAVAENRGTACDRDSESANAVHDARLKAEIVDRHVGVVVRAALERYLELARQRPRQGMAKE